jgi:hypothetical protein
MKKAFFFIVLGLFAVVSNASAQTSSDNVTLNIKLHPIHTLLVNPSQTEVDLAYQTKEDYANGVNALRANHLTVYSTGGYEIKVNSFGSELINSNPGARGNIDAGTVNITASNGSKAQEGASYTTQPLSTTGSTIVSATTGGVDNNYNIEYKGKNANAYLNHYVAGQNPTVYTTTVTYTIIGK